MRGFTLIEVMVAGILVATLFLLATPSLFRGHRGATLTETANQLVRDLRETQIRVMQGETPSGGALLDRSIRFEEDRYIVYPGVVFDSGNPENQTVVLPPTMRFTSIGVPGNTLTFARSSGDIRSFVPGADSVGLTETALGTAVTFRVNSRGVVFVSR